MNRIGIVGGGQLGRMLTHAAQELGFGVIILDPTPNSPAGQVANEQIVGDFRDADAIRALANKVDFLTFEIELANADILDELAASGVSVNPSARTLSIIKDKLGQKKFLCDHGIPVADFMQIDSMEDALRAGEDFGYPFLLKTRFDAYDGRGNAVVRSAREIPVAFQKFTPSQHSDVLQNIRVLSGRFYAEKFVPFTKELAVMAARGVNGETAAYPVVETIHKNNICHIVIAPAPVGDEEKTKARETAFRVMEHLGGVGVFAVEMFLTSGGEVIVNEIAPRVHNSGHYTIEGSVTSQFKQHILAITGQSLGSTAPKVSAAVMINILGERSGPAAPEGIREAESHPGVAVHMYGKMETRPERKMGHLTVIAGTIEEAFERAKKARDYIRI